MPFSPSPIEGFNTPFAVWALLLRVDGQKKSAKVKKLDVRMLASRGMMF